MTTENNKPAANTQSQTAPAPEGVPPKSGPDLTVQDLQALKAIIDVASQRGGFRPAEMEVVGRTYNRLATFLDAITPKEEGKADGTAPAPVGAPAVPPEATPEPLAPQAEAPKE